MSDANTASPPAAAPPSPAPGDFTRRTLRAWAVYEAMYGLALALLVVFFLPWKTPAWNVGLVLYAAAHLAAAPGLWQVRRIGFSIALAAGVVGFVLAVVVISGLVASWAYLRAIYGDFGVGASIGSLLFASVAVQILGLYPALLVRALLRREVRADLGIRRPYHRALLGLLALPLLTGFVVTVRYSMPQLESVDAEVHQQSIAYLRAALDGKPPAARPRIDRLSSVPLEGEPVFVSLWVDGELAHRVERTTPNLAEAVVELGDALAAWAQDRPEVAKRARIKVDRVVGRAPVLSEAELVVALSVDPGRDGLRRGDQWLLPDDLVKRQLFGAAPLIPGIKEIRLGLHAEPILAALAHGTGPLERVRTESWVEHERHALPVERGNTPLPQGGPGAWRQAAIDGGDFVLRQIQDDGRFHYLYYPLANTHAPPGEYSIPRHAGTVYSMALLYGQTGELRFKVGAERAIAWLNERIPESCGTPERGCVLEGQWAGLGATALSLVGMLEYQRSTGDERYAPTMRRLLEYVLMLQADNGDFYHRYDPHADVIDREDKKMFFSEEAALALVMAHEVLGDDRYLEAARRALDFLTGPKYDAFFLGNFVYGADHWTCIAAEEAWPRLTSVQYLDFCRGYSHFMGRLQYEPEGWPVGFEGHYGFSGVMVPQAPAAAGFTEAVISTWDLSVHHGQPDRELERQVAAALDALVRDQLRPANSWMMPDPAAAHGGIRRSLVEQDVRIDFTQHALSALIRGAVMERP